MQLAALTENLATVRSELKMAHEKLVGFELIKSEKAGLFFWFNDYQSSFLLSSSIRS